MRDITNENEFSVPVYTIGYEGADIDTFLKTLCEQGIETLVDVRELPLSRKKGFSKNRLREALQLVGIGYIHMKSLGDPKEGRLAARAGDYEQFERIFTSHLRTPDAQRSLHELAEIVKSTTACLLCFERCHTGCHRSIVVDELTKTTRVQVENLTV